MRHDTPRMVAPRAPLSAPPWTGAAPGGKMLLPGLYFSALILAALSGVPGLLSRGSGGRTASWMLAGAALCGLAAAGAVLYGGHPWQAEMPWALPGARLRFQGDALGAFLLAPVTVVPALLSFYSEGYWSDAVHAHTAPRLRFFFGLAAGSMILLTAAANAMLFLFAWEVMAFMSFLMICISDQDAAVREAGWVNLVAAHTGALLLFAGFSVLAWRNGGSFDLGPLPAGFAASPAGTAAFLLLLGGFGLKAGIGPFHVWLPGAHAAAPSHVSALLSGLLLKMGILGLLRILAWTPDPPLWWAGLLTAMGAASGILALASALGQRDLKRMLAYSSIENVSIIFLGLGLAFAGKAKGLPVLTLLGGAGALLHLLNHSLFKPLLFMGAGSVMHGTGTRDMERLGGLAKRMPRTALLFLAGAAAICGLPPLNGFAGEWLIYLGSLHALEPRGWIWGVVPLAALAVAVFTRAYGVVFLGEPRTEAGAHAHESPAAMLRPMGVLAGLCALIGLFPWLLAPALTRAAGELSGGSAASTPPLGDLANLGALTLMAGLGIPAFAALWFRLRRAPARRAGTWDCGYAAPTARIQYTASGFAQMLTEAFHWVLLPHERRPRIQGLNPKPGRFSVQPSDPLLDRAMAPIFHGAARFANMLRFLQSGHLSIYLVYVVLILVALFAWTLA